ncbi:hypothetical protein DQG23_25320 [Paenibacillus contaminans]|uniref:Uncharacterized protein n=1 Tax=Paenibacillus contaminans TaxID=450362 RepID=A0A329MG17_9BACL|nr:hypothetical protein DQG23_25320 [Paenibacillus contaminans]
MNFPNEFEWRTFNELPIGGAYGIFMSCSGLAGIFMRIFGFSAGMPVSCGLILVLPFTPIRPLLNPIFSYTSTAAGIAWRFFCRLKKKRLSLIGIE